MNDAVKKIQLNGRTKRGLATLAALHRMSLDDTKPPTTTILAHYKTPVKKELEQALAWIDQQQPQEAPQQ